MKLLLDEAGSPAIVGLLADLARGVPFAEHSSGTRTWSYAEFQRRSSVQRAMCDVRRAYVQRAYVHTCGVHTCKCDVLCGVRSAPARRTWHV